MLMELVEGLLFDDNSKTFLVHFIELQMLESYLTESLYKNNTVHRTLQRGIEYTDDWSDGEQDSDCESSGSEEEEPIQQTTQITKVSLSPRSLSPRALSPAESTTDVSHPPDSLYAASLEYNDPATISVQTTNYSDSRRGSRTQSPGTPRAESRRSSRDSPKNDGRWEDVLYPQTLRSPPVQHRQPPSIDEHGHRSASEIDLLAEAFLQGGVKGEGKRATWRRESVRSVGEDQEEDEEDDFDDEEEDAGKSLARGGAVLAMLQAQRSRLMGSGHGPLLVGRVGGLRGRAIIPLGGASGMSEEDEDGEEDGDDFEAELAQREQQALEEKKAQLQPAQKQAQGEDQEEVAHHLRQDFLKSFAGAALDPAALAREKIDRLFSTNAEFLENTLFEATLRLADPVKKQAQGEIATSSSEVTFMHVREALQVKPSRRSEMSRSVIVNTLRGGCRLSPSLTRCSDADLRSICDAAEMKDFEPQSGVRAGTSSKVGKEKVYLAVRGEALLQIYVILQGNVEITVYEQQEEGQKQEGQEEGMEGLLATVAAVAKVATVAADTLGIHAGAAEASVSRAIAQVARMNKGGDGGGSPWDGNTPRRESSKSPSRMGSCKSPRRSTKSPSIGSSESPNIGSSTSPRGSIKSPSTPNSGARFAAAQVKAKAKAQKEIDNRTKTRTVRLAYGDCLGEFLLQGQHHWRADVEILPPRLSLLCLPVEVLERYVGRSGPEVSGAMVLFWKHLHLWREISAHNKDMLRRNLAAQRKDKMMQEEEGLKRARAGLKFDFQPMNVIDSARLRVFQPGVDLFTQGVPRHHMLLVLRGCCEYWRVFPASVVSANVMPTRVALDCSLMPGDFSFMDGEDPLWLERMQELDYHIKGSEGESALVLEHRKKKYFRFDVHKNSLLATTRVEVAVVPIYEIAKNIKMLDRLIRIATQQYPEIFVSDEELVLRHYEHKKWRVDRREVVKIVSLERQSQALQWRQSPNNNISDALYQSRLPGSNTSRIDCIADELLNCTDVDPNVPTDPLVRRADHDTFVSTPASLPTSPRYAEGQGQGGQEKKEVQEGQGGQGALQEQERAVERQRLDSLYASQRQEMMRQFMVVGQEEPDKSVKVRSVHGGVGGSSKGIGGGSSRGIAAFEEEGSGKAWTAQPPRAPRPPAKTRSSASVARQEQGQRPQSATAAVSVGMGAPDSRASSSQGSRPHSAAGAGVTRRAVRPGTAPTSSVGRPVPGYRPSSPLRLDMSQYAGIDESEELSGHSSLSDAPFGGVLAVGVGRAGVGVGARRVASARVGASDRGRSAAKSTPPEQRVRTHTMHTIHNIHDLNHFHAQRLTSQGHNLGRGQGRGHKHSAAPATLNLQHASHQHHVLKDYHTASGKEIVPEHFVQLFRDHMHDDPKQRFHDEFVGKVFL
ncbi:hypothetical protein B484DRAFT_478427 [Ochromonadaceae sp. CCMP2298]|nr:hypothetical protein B484DRAFT_478427 [Ochromonadaceae sp. CCMP2298]